MYLHVCVFLWFIYILSFFLLDPECGTCDKLLALACGDGYIRGVDIRSRKTVSM